MNTLSRRGFSRRKFLRRAIARRPTCPVWLFAQSAAPLALAKPATRTLDIDGSVAATVYGPCRPPGGQGLTLDPGTAVPCRSDQPILDVGTIIHWHGPDPS